MSKKPSQGRKPANLMPRNTPTYREAVWIQIRKLKTFSSRELLKAVRIKALTLDSLQYYLRGWVRSGNLNAEGVGANRRYTLMVDTGVNPPRVNHKGEPITQGKSRQQMWNTMRINGQFNYRELATFASTEDHAVSERDAQDYVVHLHKAGYLMQISEPNPNGKLAVYKLKPTHNTGPKPPLVQRTKIVVDQNTRQIVHPVAEEIQGDY
ncbi:hypothetical protein [Thiomicrorhabdus indica]|uniref:hypothetical protein n=1 Tax=Thiomicrorhabdus indica TaxID=2267253 RepID=UPI002AA6B3D4|nr:hypothetical protein [Thiomicrorhabdus indica]